LAKAGHLDENPEEVFSTVYERLGSLPLPAARDPYVGMSFLSRFEIRMAAGSIEVSTRRPKK
jgi:hypothetical protein